MITRGKYGCADGKTKKEYLTEMLNEFKKVKDKNNYVIEKRQTSCMGGCAWVFTHKNYIDKKYIGYRGTLSYIEIKSKLKRIQ